MTKRQGTLGEGGDVNDSLWGRPSKVVGDFITLLRMAHNLKPRNCLFLDFSTQYFWTTLTLGN